MGREDGKGKSVVGGIAFPRCTIHDRQGGVIHSGTRSCLADESIPCASASALVAIAPLGRSRTRSHRDKHDLAGRARSAGRIQRLHRGGCSLPHRIVIGGAGGSPRVKNSPEVSRDEPSPPVNKKPPRRG